MIAGDAGAVEAAGVRLKEAGAKRVLPLPESAPFHCALMAPVKPRLESVLAGAAWSPSRVPVVTIVEARANSEAARTAPLLVEQVTAPVRWIECVQELVRLGASRLVAVVNTESSGINYKATSSILARRQGGWCEVYRAPRGRKIAAMHPQPIPGSASGIWFNQESDLVWIPGPTNNNNPYYDALLPSLERER